MKKIKQMLKEYPGLVYLVVFYGVLVMAIFMALQVAHGN